MRQGWLILHGQHKTPTWTQLNATADPGDSSITVNGIVNWVPGECSATLGLCSHLY